jgi:hypothetical protein
MFAVPVDHALVYVIAAYAVFVSLIVSYLAIILARHARVRRELAALDAAAERPGP